MTGEGFYKAKKAIMFVSERNRSKNHLFIYLNNIKYLLYIFFVVIHIYTCGHINTNSLSVYTFK